MAQFDFVDHYSNITLDTMNALKFALGWSWKGASPDFLVITDDDNYVNIPDLVKTFYDEKGSLREKHSKTIFGELYRAIPVRKVEPHMVNFTFTPQFHLPSYLNTDAWYPPHVTGKKID